MRRLAALGGQDLQTRLRLSKAQARQVDLLRSQVPQSSSPEELGYRHGESLGRDILVLRAVLLETPWQPAALARLRTGAAARFPIKAADLMPNYKGPELGARLDQLEKRWIKSGFTLSRDDLLAE
jgi:poly(A) polymerase